MDEDIQRAEYLKDELYDLGQQGANVVDCAIKLLRKILSAPFVQPAEIVSVAKVLHVFARLPKAGEGINVSIMLRGPTRTFSGQGEKHEIFHNWDVNIDGQNVAFSSGGYFRREITGGDSFTMMQWSVMPGFDANYEDYIDQHSIVDDAQPLETEIKQIDLSDSGYYLEIVDDDNALLGEMLDDDESN